MKRNIVPELERRRDRFSGYNSYFDSIVIYDLKLYQEGLTKEDKGFEPLSLFYQLPVIICSSVESYFKTIIKKLIDSNRISIDRFNKLYEIQAFHIDVSVMAAILQNKISKGELVSYLVKVNNVTNINAILSDAFNMDFFKELKRIDHKGYPKFYYQNICYWNENIDEIFKDIESVYVLRNIVCHEFSFDIEIRTQSLNRYLKNNIVFLEIVDLFINNLFKEKSQSKLSGLEMAKMRFNESDQMLDKLIEKIFDSSGKLWYDLGPTLDSLNDEVNLRRTQCRKIARNNCEMYKGAKRYKEMYWNKLHELTNEMINLFERRFADIIKEADSYSRKQSFY